MKNNKYKILVLSDLTKTTKNTLKSSASLAKMIGGTVDFFCVKKPTEIVEKESQLSAMRTINKEYFAIDKAIEKIVKPISDEFGVTITHNHTFGNVKNEIGDYISTNNPDVIVIGKRKSKIFGILGDNITDFVLKKFNGIIMIASDDNTVDISKHLSLGMLNEPLTDKNKAFTEKFISLSSNPPKVFKIHDKTNLTTESNSTILTETQEYIFDKGDNLIKNISNYLSKSNVNLLFVDREKESLKPNIKDVINNIDCTLILTN